jgi:hypothetical protein
VLIAKHYLTTFRRLMVSVAIALTLVTSVSCANKPIHRYPTNSEGISVTASNTVFLPQSGEVYFSNGDSDHVGYNADASWVASYPTFKPVPSPPAEYKSCSALHSWFHTSGAVDTGGTMAVIQLRATSNDVLLDDPHVNIEISERKEPFETLRLACAPDARVPDRGQLFAGNWEFYGGLDRKTPVLDDLFNNRREATDIIDLPERLHLTNSEPVSLVVQAQALSGWFSWRVRITGYAAGRPVMLIARDKNADFQTNSSYRGNWHASESLVICAGQRPIILRTQEFPFLC